MEQFDLDNVSQKSAGEGRVSPDAVSSHDGLTPPGDLRPNSALAKLREDADDGDDDLASSESSSDIVRRKSMPSLVRHTNYTANEEDDDDEDDSSGSSSKVLR